MNLVQYYTFGKLSHQLRLFLCIALILIIAPSSIAHDVYAAAGNPNPIATFIGATDTTPKNIILMIGDGMGPEQIIAASMYANGTHNSLAFESAPYQAQMDTASANSQITDSAAAATAMATGQKVNNGVISIRTPGNGQRLKTSLEYFQDRCKSTGLVVTSVVNHATPAAFASHANSRVDYLSLLRDYFQSVQPTLVMGGGPIIDADRYATDAGYTIVSNRAELDALPATGNTKVFGRFGKSDMPYELDYKYGVTNFYDEHPHLSEMTSKSLEILEQDPDGFFLLVEGSRIDHAGHANSLPHLILEMLEFEKSVETVLEWAEGRSDTLVIVTADHETGGLQVAQNLGKGAFPRATWSTNAHTAVDVAAYAWGPNAEMVTGAIDNTDIYGITTANSSSDANCAASTSILPDSEVAPAETTDITLRWLSHNDSNIAGFHIMRSADEIVDHAQPITSALIPVADKSTYEYTDLAIDSSVDYTYWLLIVARDGSVTVSDQLEVPRSRYMNFLPLLSH